MRSRKIGWASALMCLGLSTTVLAHPDSDSGIEGPPYPTILKQMDELATKYPKLVQVVDFGKSVRKRDLSLLKIERGAQHQGTRQAVLITGSTHGNEYLNIVDRMPGLLLERLGELPGLRAYLDGGGVIYLQPVLNPDGYAIDDRENANNKDLNRDFPLPPTGAPGFTQPETRALAQYLDAELASENLELKVSMDYHCCIGALLYPWSYTTRPIPSPALTRHQRIARQMVAIFPGKYKYGTTYEVLGYKPRGTSKDYYYGKQGTLAFTFEGKRYTENKNIEEHIAWWDWILGELAANRL